MSSGHERRMLLTSFAIEELGLTTSTVGLSVQDGIPGLLWRYVDRGKAELAMSSRAGEAPHGSFIDLLAGVARNSTVVNNLLLAPYRREVNKNPVGLLLSTHYMSFLDPNTKGIKIFIPPDIFPHKAIRDMSPDTFIWSDSRITSAAIREMGIGEDRILELPMLVPQAIADAIEPRIAIHESNDRKLNNGHFDYIQHQALVTLGASNPEYYDALAKLRWLKQVSTVQQIHVICGEGNNPINISFREEVEQLAASSEKFNIYGGTNEWSRAANTELILKKLADPEITINVSRPNEMTKIAAALRMWHLPLIAYQDHEAKVLRRIGKDVHLQRNNIINPLPGAHFILKNYDQTFGYGNNFWMDRAIGPHQFLVTS